MEKKTTERVIYFDFLNIFAALGVIFLHCNGIAHNYSDTAAWYQALGVEVLLYWPVPIFFMLSGATLMGYRERYTTAEFFKKRFLRAVIPFVAWTIISAIVKQMTPFHIGIVKFLGRCFMTSVENVYWFFIPLFSVYLAMPVLSLLKDNRRILWYMTGCAFLFSSLLSPIFIQMGWKWNGNLSMLTMGGYLIYVVLGYLLATTQLSRKQRWVIYALGVFGVLLRYGMTVYLTLRDGTINKSYFSYTQYHAVFLAAAVFVFFKYAAPLKKLAQNPKAVSLIQKLSSCSLGVYLSHMLVITVLTRFLPADTWQWRLLAPFLIYALALAVTMILKKIPILKWIVP